MPVFGLTGEPSSGKTTVLKLLKQKGAKVFSADSAVHRYYKNKKSPLFKKIITIFPQAFKRGAVDRKALAKIVFRKRAKLKELEEIIHPAVIAELNNWASRNKKNICIAEVPLLFENNLEKNFAAVILVYVKRAILIGRIEKKSGLSRSQANERLSLYLPIKNKIKKANFIINNNYNKKHLQEEVSTLWTKIKVLK
jgi:dephospho-CoA kinase